MKKDACDVRLYEVAKIIYDFVKDTTKKTTKIISNNKAFFKKVAAVENIYICSGLILWKS